jgi:transcription initiation factor TFIID TATA-box-binding protein
MGDTPAEIRIENVVASSSINQELDLQKLAEDLNVEFVPEEFPGLVYQVQNPDATALLFDSGKIVCTGADTVGNIHDAFDDTMQVLQQLGIDVPPNPTVTVENIVSSADLEQQLNLTAIAVGLGLEAVEYEPEQFPGLVHRLDNPSVTILLFGSGKLIITGARRESELEDALSIIRTQLTELGLLESTTPVDHP